jgi:hypothetical protein
MFAIGSKCTCCALALIPKAVTDQGRHGLVPLLSDYTTSDLLLPLPSKPNHHVRSRPKIESKRNLREITC